MQAVEANSEVTTEPTRVFVVAEIRLYREGLAELLGHRPGLAVAGTAAGLDEALRGARAARPDVVLLDMAMLDGIATARTLARVSPDARVVALAVPESERHVIACAEAGIVGYVSREASLADLVAAIEGAARGEAHCSPRMVASLLRRLGALSLERSGDEPRAHLTARELEIVGLIDRGLSNKEIAQALCIGLPTVKNHVHHILEKLGAERRSQAAARVRAMRYGAGPAA